MRIALGRFSLKKVLPRSLLGRSLLILAVPVILIQVISTYIFFDRHWTKMTDRLAHAVAGEVAVIADTLESGADEEQMRRIGLQAARSLDLLISYEPGAVMEPDLDPARVRRSIVARTLIRALDERLFHPFRVTLDMREKWVGVSVQLEGGVLYISLPQRRLFSSSGYIFLLWMTGTSLALLAVAVMFMRNQIRPIRRLAVAAERFGRGLDVPSSFKPEGAREVRQAAKAFLDMQERIRRQIQQRTAMLSGVSHDLRTPLTRMKLQVAMMSGPDAEDLRADIADMERMIGAYLEFARGEGGEQAVRTDLRAMLNDVEQKARRQGAAITLSMPEDIVLSLRPVAFERCLGNLVGNAAKYARHIWIEAARHDGEAEIRVDDDGPGVPEDQFEEVFKPFVRVEGSRNPATGGIGLGLPIAQDIVASHGGRIWLEKSPRGGLRVVIRLPA